MSNIVQILPHHAKGEDFEAIVVNSACFGPAIFAALVVAGHQMNIHGIGVIR